MGVCRLYSTGATAAGGSCCSAHSGVLASRLDCDRLMTTASAGRVVGLLAEDCFFVLTGVALMLLVRLLGFLPGFAGFSCRGSSACEGGGGTFSESCSLGSKSSGAVNTSEKLSMPSCSAEFCSSSKSSDSVSTIGR